MSHLLSLFSTPSLLKFSNNLWLPEWIQECIGEILHGRYPPEMDEEFQQLVERIQRVQLEPTLVADLFIEKRSL